MAEGTQESLVVKNPWQAGLEKQGLSFTIPQRFLQTSDTNFESDEKTGLTIETNNARVNLIENLSDCIRNDKKWAVVYADVDNLKTANTRYKRPFGDMVIRYGASVVTQFVEKAGLRDDVEVLATKDERAADECSVWLFNLSDEEIKRLREKRSVLDAAIKTSNPEFNFSISSAIVAYDDPRIQKQLEETRQFLTSDKNNLAYDFYQHSVKDIAEDDVGKIKIEKDLARLKDLPEDQLLTTINMGKFINSIVDIFGNSRVSDKLLDVLLKLTSAQTAIVMSSNAGNAEAYKMLLEGVGVTKEQINNAKTPNDLLNIFRDLFGS